MKVTKNQQIVVIVTPIISFSSTEKLLGNTNSKPRATKKDIDAYKKQHQDEWGEILGSGPFEVVLEGSEAEDYNNVETFNE